MRDKRFTVWGFALWFFLSAVLTAQAGALSFTLSSLAQEKKQEQQDVEKLIKQLNDDEWKVRQEATEKLIELWEDDAVKKRVEETLKKAREERNFEVQDRCERILEGLAHRRLLGKELVKALGAERVEELEGQKKREWVSVIGQWLKDKPELLSAKQREQLAEEILKDADCREYLKGMRQGAEPQVEEAWFYLGALGHPDGEVRRSAARALMDIAAGGKLEGKVVEEIVRDLLGKLEDKEVNVRRNAATVLANLAAQGKLEGKLAEEAAKAFLGKLEDKEEGVRSTAAWALEFIAAKCKLEGKLLEDALSAVEGALKKEKNESVRQQFDKTLRALKQRKRELEKKK